MTRFKDFYKLKDFDSIIQMDQKQLQIMIEDYVMEIKNHLSPNTIPTRIFPIQTFCDVNDVVINWKKIRRLFPAKVKRSGSKAWTTKNIQKMLEHSPDIRSKALIHFLASSGVRIGAIQELRLRHLTEMPGGCKSVIVYPESTEEYVTYLTPEASKVLDAYLNKRREDGELIKPESPVFRTQYQIGIQKVVPLSERGMSNVMQRVIKRSLIKREKINNGQRYDVQLDHGFRKRWNTILKLNKDVSPAIVEKMMGHKVNLDSVYLTPTDDQMFEEFQKEIADLTIDDSERVRVENQNLESEKTELEKKVNEIEQMKQQQADENTRRDQALEYLMRKEREREIKNI